MQSVFELASPCPFPTMITITPRAPSSSVINLLGIVPSVQIKIGITITFMAPWFVFFSSLAKFLYLSGFSLSFIFPLWSTGTAKSIILHVFFSFYFLLAISTSDCLVDIRLSVYISKSSLYISISTTDSGFCMYHLFVWSNLNFLHNYNYILFLLIFFIIILLPVSISHQY